MYGRCTTANKIIKYIIQQVSIIRNTTRDLIGQVLNLSDSLVCYVLATMIKFALLNQEMQFLILVLRVTLKNEYTYVLFDVFSA